MVILLTFKSKHLYTVQIYLEWGNCIIGSKYVKHTKSHELYDNKTYSNATLFYLLWN